VILLNKPLILYVLSSRAEVCSFRGCWVPDNIRRGSDSTIILLCQLLLHITLYGTELEIGESGGLTRNLIIYRRLKLHSRNRNYILQSIISTPQDFCPATNHPLARGHTLLAVKI